MNFSWAAWGGVLLKKLFLKIKKRLQQRYFPLNITKFLGIPILKNICLRLLPIFNTSTEHRWVAASVLTLLLSSDNLLTGYQQLSYWQFNRDLSISVSLAKDWFTLHKKFNQDLATYSFLSKKFIHVK